jgi:hypothetical protein
MKQGRQSDATAIMGSRFGISRVLMKATLIF